jgi:hypothetical protein
VQKKPRLYHLGPKPSIRIDTVAHFKKFCFVWLSNKNFFYLPHMEYEGSIGFVMRKMKKIIADFHVLGLLMAKKHDLPDKKNRPLRGVAGVAGVAGCGLMKFEAQLAQQC